MNRSVDIGGDEIAIICYSVISCCFSLLVIGTILFFPAMKKGHFMPIILYMSWSDFGINVASAFGFPASRTPLCWIQGLMQNMFALSSWLWTTILTYRVYCFVRYGKCKLKKRHMHLIGWGLPFFLTFIPLTTTDYGANDSQSQSCIYVRRGNSPLWLVPFWSYVTFFFWLFLCIFLMLVWQLIIVVKFRSSPLKGIVSRTYDKVYLYPIAMCICWSVCYWCDLLATKENPLVSELSVVFGISNGVFSALIFMFKSEEAQNRWRNYLFPPKRSSFEEHVEPMIRLDFENDMEDAEFDDEGTIPADSFSQNVSEIRMSEMIAKSPIHREPAV